MYSILKNKKDLAIIIGLTSAIFLTVLAYWKILLRTATRDIPGEGIYTGQLRGHAFHGYGNYISYELKGTSYEGEWRNGAYHGQGTMTFANGSKVVGQFKNGFLYGEGIIVCADGHENTVDFGEPVHAGGCSE